MAGSAREINRRKSIVWNAPARHAMLHGNAQMKGPRMTTQPPTTADATRFLEENFADWVRALDLTIAEIGPSGAVLTMPITPALARVGGILSGQALAAMADTAMVFACAGHLGRFAPVATTDLHTSFLRPGTGDAIRCEAKVIRAGKALIFARATMIAEPSQKPVATATATFFLP